jgi:hypothetical protein
MNDDLERRLREALHKEADRIKPRERRTEILAMTHNEAPSAEPGRRWLIPVAAAASVALIGAVVWGVSNSGGDQQSASAVKQQITATSTPTPAPPVAATAGPAPATVQAPKPSPDATSKGSLAAATTPVTVPAYFVGATSSTGRQFGLYREFVRTTVPVGATAAQKARAAVAVAMNAQPLTYYEPYLQPWAGTSVTRLTLTPGRINITLSGPGARGFTAAQTRLAVQQLVWSAQAALGQGPIPVKFAVANGAAKLFGTYPTNRTYNRPARDLQFEVLAPIWITSPVRNQVFAARSTVLAAGQSCAFEGTTQWQLRKSGRVVRTGVTTASSGCPTRGTWQVKLGVLGAGSYSFRMYERGMENGQVIAETSKPFTVK